MQCLPKLNIKRIKTAIQPPYLFKNIHKLRNENETHLIGVSWEGAHYYKNFIFEGGKAVRATNAIGFVFHSCSLIP